MRVLVHEVVERLLPTGGSRWAPENIDALDFELTETQRDAIATPEAGT